MKKSVMLIAISLLLLIMGGCKKEKNNIDLIIDNSVNVLYKNDLGNNLLDSTTSNYYSYANMHMFYLDNGVKKEYYNGKMDAPKGIRILKDTTGEYVLAFYFHGYGVNDTVINFLQLSDTDTDTLVGIFDHYSNGVILTKAWYNGVLWKPGAGPNFTIVKK